MSLQAQAPDTELAHAFERGIAAPLRAALTSLGQLSRDLEGREWEQLEQSRTGLNSALRQAEAMVELFAQRPLCDDACTVRELAASARASLPTELRDRVWIATEPGEDAIHVDAPTFSRALGTLLARAIEEEGDEVMLHGHQEDGEATFAIVEGLGTVRERQAVVTPEELLARQDLDRMGAIVTEHVAGPHRCCTVRLSSRGGEIR